MTRLTFLFLALLLAVPALAAEDKKPEKKKEPPRVIVVLPLAVTPGATNKLNAINARNQFRGKVKEIIEGPVVSEVDVETPSGLIVTSVITTRSVKELGLAPGRDVIALVKATEVSLATL